MSSLTHQSLWAYLRIIDNIELIFCQLTSISLQVEGKPPPDPVKYAYASLLTTQWMSGQVVDPVRCFNPEKDQARNEWVYIFFQWRGLCSADPANWIEIVKYILISGKWFNLHL